MSTQPRLRSEELDMNDSRLIYHSTSTEVTVTYFISCPVCGQAVVTKTENPDIQLCVNSHMISISWGGITSHLTVRATECK
jgi:hypothetical protein